MLVLAALDSRTVLARDARALWLEVIVDVDLRVGSEPWCPARKQALAESKRLAPYIALLALQFLYDLGRDLVTKLFDVPEVSINIL